MNGSIIATLASSINFFLSYYIVHASISMLFRLGILFFLILFFG